jgi:hypothetical protein
MQILDASPSADNTSAIGGQSAFGKALCVVISADGLRARYPGKWSSLYCYCTLGFKK